MGQAKTGSTYRYEVLRTGKIICHRTDSDGTTTSYFLKEIPPTATSKTYRVRVQKTNGGDTYRVVDQLVAAAHLGWSKHNRTTIEHIDGNNANSHVDNLRIVEDTRPYASGIHKSQLVDVDQLTERGVILDLFDDGQTAHTQIDLDPVEQKIQELTRRGLARQDIDNLVEVLKQQQQHPHTR